MFIIAMFLLLTILLSLIYFFTTSKYWDKFVRSFSLSLKGGISNISSIILFVYFLIHISWVTDNLQESFKEDLPISYILLSFAFMLFPFIINPFIRPDPISKEVSRDTRKVLITALSENDIIKLKIFRDKKYELDDIVDTLKTGGLGAYWNWEPIIDIVKFYPNLNEIILIQSRKVVTQLNGEKLLANSQIDAFEDMLNFNQINVKYTPIEVNDMDLFDDTYNTLKFQLNKLFKNRRYSNEEIIFGISSGTSVLTACLLFLALPGKRGTVYKPQKPNSTPEEFEVDILTIEELWGEIFEKF